MMKSNLAEFERRPHNADCGANTISGGLNDLADFTCWLEATHTAVFAPAAVTPANMLDRVAAPTILCTGDCCPPTVAQVFSAQFRRRSRVWRERLRRHLRRNFDEILGFLDVLCDYRTRFAAANCRRSGD